MVGAAHAGAGAAHVSEASRSHDGIRPAASKQIFAISLMAVAMLLGRGQLCQPRIKCGHHAALREDIGRAVCNLVDGQGEFLVVGT